ncbi:M20/M25/M40 family metallo-hydrolase [Arcanobacterium hippocoleae]|uniref:Acetylornithine deacetylase/succinyl-diaminopimelate desuccinylase-like protein n=1 Tax=Arcanobacterium hippocoleae TaxID=149017 RepID=A0ABU1T0I1_9ACTO|nr:M20/M25/M40 family metallo-hydrolase [Arcanobacterium hippocoleae]MDR6938882.1 acetylornithine deacetylase/succinyl-diaminopimelate desuccinylase-like protein [Arcanobacterium hippocoleae]
MSIENIAGQVAEIYPKALQELIELVAIPSISASSFDQSTLEKSAQWICGKAQKLGLESEVIQIQTADGKVGRPAVLATRQAKAGKPTVLLYAHHDVQPVGELDLWEQSDPFAAVERDGRLFGRGAADDKAGVMLHLAAIEAADPEVGIVLFVEGEEEVGSPTFVEFLETYKERLAADVIVVADSNNWKVGTPSLTTSLRGVVQVGVSVAVLDHALHSGAYSGPTLDAPTIACRLISTLHNECGEVAVAGLLSYDDAQVDYPEADLRKDMGMLDGVELTGTGSLTSRLWTKPTITLIAMDITPTAKASNTLLPKCDFVLSLRVAPGQDPAAAGAALVQHLQENVPFGARIEVAVNECGPGFEAKAETEVTQIAKWALREAWGRDSVDIGVGGSIPFISTLAEVFPQADILVTGVEDPDTRAHSANESLELADWKNAILAEALLLTKLGA